MSENGVCWRWLLGALCLGWAALSIGCSPTLNWRTAQLGRLSVSLPCKPDRATRLVQVGDHQLSMEMLGCEAGGSLVAVSHVRVEPGQAANETVVAWKARALQNMKSQYVKELPLRPGHSVDLQATGSSEAEGVIQANLAWIVDGQDVFHLATYAKTANPELVDILFTDLKLQ